MAGCYNMLLQIFSQNFAEARSAQVFKNTWRNPAILSLGEKRFLECLFSAIFSIDPQNFTIA